MQTSFMGYVLLGLHSLFSHQFGCPDKNQGDQNRPVLGQNSDIGRIKFPTSAFPYGIRYNGTYGLTTFGSQQKNCLKTAIYEDYSQIWAQRVVFQPCEENIKDRSQEWKVLPDKLHGEGYFKLRNVLSNKCMQVGKYLGSLDITIPIIQGNCDDEGQFSRDQVFVAHKTRSYDFDIPGVIGTKQFSWIQIKPVQSNKCITAPSGTSGRPYMEDCVDIIFDQWFHFVGEGYN